MDFPLDAGRTWSPVAFGVLLPSLSLFYASRVSLSLLTTCLLSSNGTTVANNWKLILWLELSGKPAPKESRTADAAYDSL